MLETLTIRNTAIIDSLTVEFGEGMNCLTGETGAGKSIIIDSLCCLLGERVSKDSIRRGESEASVQGVFFTGKEEIREALETLGVPAEEDGTLILYRSFNVSGRNVCRINNVQVTLSGLRKIGELLVDIHGQHDNHSLLCPQTHIELLDAFAAGELPEIKEKYNENIAKLKAIDEELESISGDPAERARLLDLLNFQAEEIYNAKLVPGEEDELLEKQKIIDNSEKIMTSLGKIKALLSDDDYDGKSIISMLGDAHKTAQGISSCGDAFSQIEKQLGDAYFTLQDAEENVRNSCEEGLFDPEEADKIQNRLDLIYNLKRKYGGSIEEIISFGEDVNEKIEKLSTSEERASELLCEKKKIRAELLKLSEKMNKIRCEAAGRMKTLVEKSLSDMEMGRVRFSAKIDFDENADAGSVHFGKNGLDTVEFVIAANPGEDMKPLAKVASGGELSRIMLAIKSVLADIDEIPVLVFDEIDTGISGNAAIKVAGKFKLIGKTHQVICVSHLAQIAAAAENNIFVSKEYFEDCAKTKAEKLTEEGKVKEVARLLDGNDFSEITRAHACELIKKATLF